MFDPAVRITVQVALDHEYLSWPKERVGSRGALSLEAPAPAILSMIDIEEALTQSVLLDLIKTETHPQEENAPGRRV